MRKMVNNSARKEIKHSMLGTFIYSAQVTSNKKSHHFCSCFFPFFADTQYSRVFPPILI
ncbi:hypothetical protein RchiOBHm_Chr2g0084871 [Rosa chinensis]|uniref:Uncharacterized protein n=1 Tax=Rosa chinensis TaxID=74649 RepID=A0A2P6RHZ0_ROSCH|nr:hypothetical protein RchiOBHm_Chr2g0084871 [Rosa chinensis]